jgi:peptide/nickel transport system permease protein
MPKCCTAASLGPGIKNLIIVIAMFLWAQYARVIRAETLAVREFDYVTAARAVGASNLRILSRHIFPNLAAILIVLVTTQIGTIVLLEASLSFLGAGVPPPEPSWGGLVSGGRSTSAWWISLFSGLAIVFLVLAYNLLGDWLRDVLDPRLRRV